MEELFRFTITRSAERTNTTTLPLERRSPFQEILVRTAAEHEWLPLEEAAMNYIEGNLSWILTLINQTPEPPVGALKQLLSALQAVQAGSPPHTWQEPIQIAADLTNADQLDEMNVKLADLFLALLILRSNGPMAIDKLIRSRNLPPSFAEVLLDRPTLNDIADLLRMIYLVMNAPQILHATSPIKTADDVQAALTTTLLFPPDIFSRFEKPIHAIGVTELLVVKQHLARYEMGEVARIENILKGESRGHSQKHTLSNERDTVFDTSTETQTDQELTSTDHVSLQNEIENTLKEETKVDAGVHVQYDGGSLKAQADLTVGYDRSSSDSKKFASNIAKDVTQKAAKKITQKVQQTVTTKIIETFEETEDQTFDNKIGKTNISGVYQWVEKVYLAQVFKYGKHLLFDIMVPEPAASLLQVANIPPPDQTMPVKPDPLEITIRFGATMETYPLAPYLLTVEEANKWIGKLQVVGVEPPPPDTIVVAESVVADGRDQSQNDVKVSKVIQLVDGYKAKSVSLAAAWFTGERSGDYQVDVQVGATPIHFQQASTMPAPTKWGENNFSATVSNLLLQSEEKSIAITVKTVYTDQVSINFEILCESTGETKAKWQLQAFEKIVTRWQKLQSDYEEKVSNLQYHKGATGPLGAADPETNRQIERSELKRSCIALLANSNEFTNGFDALVPKTPNQIPDSLFAPDLTVAETRGSWVRWFEQAFEWDKIGYVFYPYYWGRASEWVKRLDWKNDDPLFLNFLQAGYARVVIPVRNGFEDAINFFVLTGKPWLGGGLPKIGDKVQNPLYLSITDEMKEQSGAPGGESPYGEPWEIRLPTTLIRLRDDDKLPMWKWDPPGTYPPSPPSLWTWEEDKAREQKE